MGRPSKAQPLIERLEASEVARERTTVMLLTLSGQWEVRDALERLSLSRTRFQVLRQRMLSAAVRALEPGAMGRPRRVGERASGCGKRVAALRQEIRLLRTRLELSEGPAAATILERLQGKAIRKGGSR